MKKVYRIVMAASYLLGVLSLLLAILLRFWAGWLIGFAHSPRGALLFAGTLFLCALASAAMAQPEAS